MYFELIGTIAAPQTFAIGTKIHELPRLRKTYGAGRWRKRKGTARIRLADGSEWMAELHWYEATGVGRKELKIKQLMKQL